MDINAIKSYLKEYDGEEVNLMEVCGTHTASISENGIPSMLSQKINLISGPGCPVCVTVSSFIDRLIELSLMEKTTVVSFGDMLRVQGSKMSLTDAKALGASVSMVYSPMQIIDLAKKRTDETFIFASVGFETTTPIYALLIEKLINENIKNVKLLTALKTMPAVIKTLCQKEHNITGFIAPGHVAVITGANAFLPLAKEFNVPFVVSGFSGEELLLSIYALTKLKGTPSVKNFYKSVVNYDKNEKAFEIVNKYFEPCDASWRGLGIIKNSGLKIRDEYSFYDAGSYSLLIDEMGDTNCSCSEIITGLKKPYDCPLFAKACTPSSPKGACMVSLEGSCYNYFTNNRKK